MSIFLQTHSTINDIFECFLHQIEFIDFKHATPSDLREILLLYVDEKRERNNGMYICKKQNNIHISKIMLTSMNTVNSVNMK